MSEQVKLPKVAIIVINWKDYAKKYLSDWTASVRAIHYPKDLLKIYLVDNEASPETQKYIKEICPECYLIGEETNSGFAKGNNLGIKKAYEHGYDYVYMVNMDMEFDPYCLVNLLKLAEKVGANTLLQSKVLLDPEKDLINSLGNSLHFLGFGYCNHYRDKDEDFQEMPAKQVAYASGAALLVNLKILEQIGLFNEEYFMYHEDLDLSWRARLAGFRVAIEPKSVVYHKYEFVKSIKQYYFMERNRIYTCLVNYKIWSLLVFFPAWLIMELGLFVFAFKGGWWKQKLRVYAYFINPANWFKIIKDKLFVRKLREVKDRSLLKLFTGKIAYQEPEMQNWALKYIANPIFTIYFYIVRALIWW